MSHFTLLTAVQFPDDINMALAQLPSQDSISNIVSALRLARLEDQSKLQVLDKQFVAKQLCIEQVVQALVFQQLEPYWEHTEEPEYLKFVDCIEECRQEYETEGQTLVRTLNGREIPEYSGEFCYLYEVYEGKVYKRQSGPLHHRKRTKKAQRMTARYVPHKERYRTLEQFATEHCGYCCQEESGAYGYYINPNAKWDWLQIGGRWPNRFLVKEDCQMVVAGDPSFLLKGHKERPAPEGYCWVTGARKCDIAWDAMKDCRIKEATEAFHMFEGWYRNGQIPKGTYLYSITDEGIKGWDSMAYVKGETLEDYLARKGLPDLRRYPVGTYAYLGDDGWVGSGDAGWFGISSNDKEETVWDQMVEKFVAALPEDAVLVSIDCHI